MVSVKEEFLPYLRAKQRALQITIHAQNRSVSRSIPISVFEADLKGEPVAVVEKQADRKDERMFDLYYHQRGDYFHRYVVVLNDCLRLITLMRVSKSKQVLAKNRGR